MRLASILMEIVEFEWNFTIPNIKRSKGKNSRVVAVFLLLDYE